MSGLEIDVGDNTALVTLDQDDEIRVVSVTPHFEGADPVTDDEIKDAVAEWRHGQCEDPR